jgi:RNA polymerase sigma-70 factor, ECF subfamily
VSTPGTDPLLLGLAAGDEQAFAALYDRFAARMYRVALRMLGSREDAEDVVQEVFMATVRSRQRLGDVRDLAAYLFVSLNRAAGRCAHRRRKAVPVSPLADEQAIAPVDQAGFDAEQWHRVHQAILTLPEDQREVLSLRIDGELTFAQISRVVGVSLSTAASRYQYALRKLKTSLAGAKVSLEGTW